MKTIEQLYNWFYLNEWCENTRISSWKIPLRVAPIKKASKYKNLEIDYEHFAFAEKNENWQIEYFHWLKNFLLIEKSDFPPIFIFDNHDHAPVFWYYCIKEFWLNIPVLIHIDQHSDCWENKNHLELTWYQNELEKVFTFYNEKCNVGNFIPPSLESWIISNQTQIRSIVALQNLQIKKNQNFILDIDLDFCLNWIDRKQIDKESVKFLKEKFDEIWKYASCITIATSPYFLDQNVAINILEKMFTQ